MVFLSCPLQESKHPLKFDLAWLRINGRCCLGRPEFLDSDLLCVIDNVYDTSYKNGTSFAKEKTREDKGGIKRKKNPIKKME